MRIHTIWRPALLGALLFFLATAANAQTPPDTFDSLRSVVKAGDRITVTGASGGVFDGRLLDLTPTTIALDVDDMRREFAIDDVRSISRRQHANVRKGAWWGFGIGAGFGLLGLPATECRVGPDCGTAALKIGVVMGGLGAAIGAGFAASTVADRVIFEPRSGVKVSFAPMVDRQARGVRMSVRF
jgi:hypothetical protein